LLTGGGGGKKALYAHDGRKRKKKNSKKDVRGLTFVESKQSTSSRMVQVLDREHGGTEWDSRDEIRSRFLLGSQNLTPGQGPAEVAGGRPVERMFFRGKLALMVRTQEAQNIQNNADQRGHR